ncbi:hypothetical protein ES703_113134 [subsurface metagenome]
MTSPWKIIHPAGEDVGVIDKAIAVGIGARPVAPVVAAYWLVEVEDVAPAASSSISLYCVVDEVVVVDLVIAGRLELDSIAVVRDGVICQGVVAARDDSYTSRGIAQSLSTRGIGANEVAQDLVACHASAVDFDAVTAVACDDVARPDRVIAGFFSDFHAVVAVAQGCRAIDSDANVVALHLVPYPTGQ